MKFATAKYNFQWRFFAVAVAVAVLVAEAPYSSKISQSLIYIYVAEMNTSNIHRGSLVTLLL